MPNRNHIHKSAKQAPGFKACKEGLTPVIRGNTARYTVKSGVVYRAKNPQALKNNSKIILPVFCQHNLKAWVTAVLFTEWFHQFFNLELKEYLEKEGLPLKVLLIIDKAPGHPQSISIEDENFEVVFLTPNTTSLLQGNITCVKASYARHVFEMIREVIDVEPNLQVMDCWKSFTIADAVTFLEASMDELNTEKFNAC